jgi:CBS domain containing-hemolysin-like protein
VTTGWALALAGLLVIANGFFVATEFALVKLRRSRLQALAEEGRAGAARLLEMHRALDAYLAASQFGITLASLGLGWVGEPAFASLMEGWLTPLFPEGVAAGVAHTISFALAFATITFLHIVLGEQVPKYLAIQKAEPVGFALALPMRGFFVIFFPGVWVLNEVSNAVLRLFGVRRESEGAEAHSEDELRVIFTSSAEAGAIAHSRAELLERALAMLEKTARQVMVPRSQVRFLDLDEALEKNIAEARAGGHTVLPVCRGNLDHVQGMVNVKDLFFLLSRGELRSLSQVQRPVLFVPETISLEQLLSEYKRSRRQLAVVVDEHGGTSGIVTIADVVAELVGNVAELGRKVEEVKLLPGGRFELPGTAQLEDLHERLDLDFGVKDSEVSTIAGFLMLRLGRVPEKGDRVAVGHYEVKVEEVDGPRVVRVRVEPNLPKVPQTPQGPPPPGAASGPKG